MANVLHHHIDFHPRPVSHSPSPFAFGFGLGVPTSVASTSWQPTTPGHTNPAAFHQLASSINQASSSRTQKRRYEGDDDGPDSTRHTGARDPRDDSMDRSPTPDRPKRAAPKRARVIPATDLASKEDVTIKENKVPNKADEDEVDVGVLLASLPTQSLLPLLTALLKAQPALKSALLPLIPRPTLETAIHALAASAKKLTDAYPYSTSSQSSMSMSFGFGRAHNHPNAGHQSNGGMRDSYILSRLRPHIVEFVAACMSYLPYFTCIPASSSTTQSNSTIQSLHTDKFYPSETFIFLSAVTNHVLSQPHLTQSSLAPLLLPRLLEEWKAWVAKIDQVVNHQGGMFGSDTVRTWERGLDEMAGAKLFDGSQELRVLRDKWITSAGWLVGRTMQHDMEEL